VSQESYTARVVRTSTLNCRVIDGTLWIDSACAATAHDHGPTRKKGQEIGRLGQ